MDRAPMEQQARADQATTAQHAQRRAAAAQAAGIGASAVVDTRHLTSGVRWARDELEIVQIPVPSLLRSHRQSPEGLAGSGRNLKRGSNAQHPRGPGHASSQCSAVPHADQGVPRVRRCCWITRETLRVQSHGGDCWTSTSQEPQDGGVLCCKNSFTTGSLDTREQLWISSRCCFVDTAQCLNRTSARA